VSSTGEHIKSKISIIPEESYPPLQTNLNNEQVRELSGYGTEDGEEFHEDDHVCNFCGRYDTSFN